MTKDHGIGQTNLYLKQLILNETGGKQNFYHFVTKNKTFFNKPPNLTGRYILNMSRPQPKLLQVTFFYTYKNE